MPDSRVSSFNVALFLSKHSFLSFINFSIWNFLLQLFLSQTQLRYLCIKEPCLTSQLHVLPARALYLAIITLTDD